MIQNRDAFLKDIAQKLGRDVKTQCDPMPTPVNNYAQTRYTDLTREQLTEMFLEASQKMYAKVTTTSEADVTKTVNAIVAKYGDPVLLACDKRLDDLGVTDAVKGAFKDVRVFDKTKGEECRDYALRAKTSIIHADYAIADCGFYTIYASDDLARCVSLLPENSIIIMRRSTLLPRVAQFAKMLDERVAKGERLPSVVNVVGGPSSTADIELVKCIGVHGPMVAEYILIED